ncbi:MAG: outer membrane lipoprotein-sorting protein [Acidobacteria bacterium]|nr:outer membrane lipoprotein-sorting protein [Acidobacteriota bacterium]
MTWMASRRGRRLAPGAALLLAAAGALPCPGQTLPGAADLIEKVVELRDRSDFRARGRMVVSAGGQQQRVFQISVLRKRMASSTNLLWSITDPPQDRLRILVEAGSDGRTSVWMAERTLPARRWGEAVPNTGLTVEDLVEGFLSWPSQTVLRQELFGTRQCYVLRSKPGSGEPSAYTAITTWIDQATLLPVRILKQPRAGGPPKEFLCRGMRRSGGHWLPTQMEVRTEGRAGGMRLVFTRGSENVSIKDSEVDPRVLFRPGAARP